MGHWYKQDSTPLYQINKVGSKEKRDTHLGDAKKLGLVPSVTTIINILDKAYLEKWRQDHLFDAIAESLPKGKNEDFTKYKNRILPLYREKTQKASKRGTELHDKLERYFLSGEIDEEDQQFITPTIELLNKEFSGEKWIPEASFACMLGYGGKVDLYSKSGIILDFKTKAKDELDKKCLYDDYCIQLAAYRLGLNILDAKCYNLVISTTVPGTLYLHQWTEEELKSGLEKFKAMLTLWQLLNKYDSSWGYLNNYDSRWK